MDVTAREVMSGKVLVASPSMTVEECLKVLVNSRVTGPPVVDDAGRVVGVVSEYDVLKILKTAGEKGGEKGRREALSHKITYSSPVEAIPEDLPLDGILARFIQTKVRRFPVLDRSEKLVGIVTRRDLIRVLYYRTVVE